MAPVDIKQRYSLYVPKPLARINLGDWQRRDLQSPKFGYAGVSIQTDSNLFVDITKVTHIQAKGGFVAQALDWLQTSKNAMYLATTDNATMGADGTLLMAGGAGHGPTYTLDHGDTVEPYPYNPLTLHYRIEEVQNSLFDFFRGKREKHKPSKAELWASLFFKKEDLTFNSSTHRMSNPLTAFGENPLMLEGAKEEEKITELRGGFERVANVSWQRLFGEAEWDVDKTEKVAPHDIFDGIGDIRADPLKEADGKTDKLTKALVEGNDGKLTERELVYGFSAYFSRFDPYQMIDPDRFQKDYDKKKISLFEKGLLKIFAYMNNALVKLRRTLDVVYKIGSILKDNSLFKSMQDLAATVDSFNGAIKAWRGQVESLILSPYVTHKQGTFYDQMADEEASGHGARAKKLGAMGTVGWAAKPTTKAAVRSGTADKDHGFYATGAELAAGDSITIETVDENGAAKSFTVALSLDATDPTAAKIAGGSATVEAIVFPVSWVQLQYDGGPWTKVNLPATNVMSLASATAADAALVLAGQAAHFVADRQTAIDALQTAVCNGVGAPYATIASSKITLQSSVKGAPSKVRLAESKTGILAALGLAKLAADGADAQSAKAPKDLTAADIVALLGKATNAAGEKATDFVTLTAEGDQVVIACKKKEGDGSKVSVSGALAGKLGFVGDTMGRDGQDEVKDWGDFYRGQDDFEKAMIEVNQLPQDTANLTRPMVSVWKGAVGAVTKVNNALKAAIKVGSLKLPTNKGAIGLVANSGISLGTPDRIVGAGGQGIVFIADGGTGKPDHAKYAMLEDIVNRIAGADLAAAIRELALGTPPAPIKPSLGFRVFSDTTVDLTGRGSANLVALGRGKDGAGGTTGVGVARVAGSYATEIAGQRKVVVRAQQKDAGRVEVLGSTIALGFSEIDAAEKRFGLDLQTEGGPKGWPAKLKEEHPQTSSVLVHSTDQASIIVGDYMVQLRAKQTPKVIDKIKADKKEVTDRLKAFNKEKVELTLEKGLKTAILAPPLSPADEYAAAQDRIAEIDLRLVDVGKEITADTAALRKLATAEKLARTTNDEGVVISMRDTAEDENDATTSFAWKEKPSIVLSRKGVTITTTTGKDDDAKTARITLDEKGISVHVGHKQAGIMIKKDSVQLSNGSKKAILQNNGTFQSSADKIDFSAAQKITLG